MKKAKTLGVKRGKLGHNVGEEGSQNTHGTPRATLGDTAHRPLVLPPGGTPTRGDTHPLTGNPHPPWGPPTRVPPSPKNLPSASKRRQAPRKAAASKRAAAPLSMVLPRPRKSRAGPAQPLPVARRPPRLWGRRPRPGGGPTGGRGKAEPPHHACGGAPCLNHGVGAPGWVWKSRAARNAAFKLLLPGAGLWRHSTSACSPHHLWQCHYLLPVVLQRVFSRLILFPVLVSARVELIFPPSSW